MLSQQDMCQSKQNSKKQTQNELLDHIAYVSFAGKTMNFNIILLHSGDPVANSQINRGFPLTIP